MADLKFEIVREIGVLSEGGKGWQKLLTLTSWNGAEPKYDVRSWSPDRSKMSKGVTLTEEELQNLKHLIP